MKKKFIFFFTIGSFMLTSCVKEEPVSCVWPNPEISITPTVFSGESINLKVIEDFQEEGIVYQWTGPNNFSSSLKNPIITNATLAMTGEYKLKVSKGICISDEVSSNVEVISNTANCNQSNDTATFTNGVNISSFVNNTQNELVEGYSIRASSFRESVEVIFSDNAVPSIGVYSIVNKSTALSSGKVHVVATETSDFGDVATYYAKSGDVQISYTSNGKAIVKFCQVPFSFSTNAGTDTIGSCKFTVNN